MERGVALVPLHPSDFELDSSDKDVPRETEGVDTSERSPSKDKCATTTFDSNAGTGSSRRQRSLTAASTCPPKKKKSRSHALLPIPVLDDEEDEGPQRPGMGRAQSRK